MGAVAAPQAAEWVSGCQAKKLSGLSWYMLHKHVMLGKVRALAEPGCLIKYHRGDCERLAHSPVANPDQTRLDASSPAHEKPPRAAVPGGSSKSGNVAETLRAINTRAMAGSLSRTRTDNNDSTHQPR